MGSKNPMIAERIYTPSGKLLLSERGALPLSFGNPWYVDPVHGSDSYSGQSPDAAFATLQKAFNSCAAYDDIFTAPGALDESPVLPRGKHNVRIFVVGGRGSSYIDPTVEDADGLTVHADDVEVYGLGCAGEDGTSAIALTVSGARFRAYGCKLEQGLTQLKLLVGTVAQQDAGTHGDASDALFVDCEFAWGTNGVVLTASDYGAVTQAKFKDCEFHNLSAAAFEESSGSGGSAAVHFFDLLIKGCSFGDLEDGTAPTKFISLNDDNANAGKVEDCYFPTAINSGKNLVSTALHWVSNKHTGGVSTAQPS